EEFDPISERIAGIEAGEAWQRLVVLDFHAAVSQPRPQVLQIVDDESGVRFPSRPKIRVDSEVYLHGARLEPATAASLQVLRLGGLIHPEQPGIESSGLFFHRRGHD